MPIVHLVAGAGGMYCGACLHANTLVRALRRAGGDAVLAPLYTPLRVDEDDASLPRVHFGGINVCLQQASGVFRWTPAAFDRLLDRPGLLRWLSRRGAGVDPRRLGPMTVSMLRGEAGRQRKELDKLLHWLQRDARPTLVHLSTLLLAGVARRIHRALGVPVVATLSGEDLFLQQLPAQYGAECRAILRERAAELAAVVAMNRYYAARMAEYLNMPVARIAVIPPGLNLQGHRPLGAAATDAGLTMPTIGYMARVCPQKGLDLLAQALALLVRGGFVPEARVEAAGYLGHGDRKFLAQIEARLAADGLAERFRYHGEVDRSGKIALVQGCRVLCCPAAYPESKGLPALEAWANGVPVVAPAAGAFPELVEDTGGGLLYKPHDAASLAEALARLLNDPDLARQLGRRGQAAVYDRYSDAAMAQRMLELYGGLGARDSTKDEKQLSKE